MDAQHTSVNVAPAPLTVRCCSQHSRGGHRDDGADPATRADIDSGAVTDAVRQDQSADTERAPRPTQ